MRITVIKGTELTQELTNIWTNIQEMENNLSSPFFCPHYTIAVSLSRKDVYVGIIENENKIVGFFPFQRNHNRDGKAVGAGMSDYQGVIIKPNTNIDAIDLIQSCGLKTWEFDHLISNQKIFQSFHKKKEVSPIIKIPNGYNSYKVEKNMAGTKQILQVEKKIKLITSEKTPLRFDIHVNDITILHKLIRWKSEQCKRLLGYDDFGLNWIIQLQEYLFSIKDNLFSGILSVLYCEEKPIAAHLGLCHKNVWHWWIPGYDRNYSRYSPGLILLLKMIEIADSIGVKIIDMGKGCYHYKKRFMNGSIEVAEGFINPNN